VAIKKFDKAQFYDKVNIYKFFTEVEKEEESENLCRKAFSKECEMLSRLVCKIFFDIIHFLCIGGVSDTLFILLLISNLCCTKAWMDGGGDQDEVNSLRPAGTK
jgi:hypothetical protein